MKILWFKKVQEIANNNQEFKATVSKPWNPEASFAVYQYHEGWTQDLVNKHAKLCDCKGEIRETESGKGMIAYIKGKEDNSSALSDELVALLQSGTAK